MEAVGESALYGARLERVRSARRGLDDRLEARLELIDKYAKVAAMIEIEVEMDADVAQAELQLAAEGISDEISRIEGAQRWGCFFWEGAAAAPACGALLPARLCADAAKMQAARR